MTRLRRRWTAVGVVLATAALTSCTTAPEGAADTSRVRVAVTADATSFDPARGNVAADYQFARLAHDTLVRMDPEGETVPGLAASWEESPTEVVFTLRDGLLCSDGTDLDADTVAAALEYLASPETGSPVAGNVFGAGEPEISSDTDAGTVTVTLESPWSGLLPGLSSAQAGIPCSTDPEELASGRAPGTGAYTLTDSQRGSEYTYSLREDYDWAPDFGAQGSFPETVTFQVIENEGTVANQMETGQIDYAAFTGADSARFDPEEYTVVSRPTVFMFLVFNEREGRPGADPRVREAVARSVDREAFRNAVTSEAGTLLNTVVSADFRCALDDASLLAETDPDTAARALDGVEMNLVGTNAIAGGTGNEYVRAALAEAGARIDLRNVDNATWGSEVLGAEGDWDVTVMAALNPSGTLTPTMSLLAGPPPPDGRNFGAVDSPGLTEGFQSAMSSVDAEDQCAAWQDAQRAMLEGHHAIPLSSVDVSWVMAEHVSATAFPTGVEISTLRITD
ncbi:ABC transporter substrate-binding protein [Nocardiopsis ganjiahuensis]|uniref:ABC transporter substrate-binding protein n=1 Tax=Nocardiopsis ganjiahuensis TaxID=239984 RepID=UPI001267FD7C|nr:ABC transporter substrate-binding protein [Nocardiopsis ganjiahuensis]